MRISSVICEYNPFHNGHRFMLEKMRNGGATHIVACMSGNFIQRGDLAIFDKWTRTHTALLNGADLVIELPISFACAGAEKFSFGGAYILNSLGCVDELSFGIEYGDLAIFYNILKVMESKEFSVKIKEYLSNGITFAAAREKVLKYICGESVSKVLSQPNNILALEYLKALKKLNSNISPSAIMRIGASHDSEKTQGKIASASHLRKLIYQKNNEYLKYIPENTHNIINDEKNFLPDCTRIEKISQSLLYRMRMMKKEDFAQLPDISEGLENRIFSAVKDSTDYKELLMSIKCKRYTLARIRRCILHAFLGITKNSAAQPPPYIRILGFNQKGRDVLRIMRKSSSLPVIMRYSDIKPLSDKCRETFEFESICDDIYALSGKKILECGKNYTQNIIIL